MLDNYYNLAGQQEVVIVTFVHGWHHSAKPEDGNIQEFRKLLSTISARENDYSQKFMRKKRLILGVYIGWRGDSLNIEYLNTVTFWDRKATAHEVGHKGITEALLKLEELKNVRNSYDEGQPSANRLVTIGHSFGGAVVFSALQKIMAERFIDSQQDKNYQQYADGFGDLVILMNPAFEALRFSSLMELSQDKCRKYQQGQLPKLAILTSETDYATKLAFPAGRIFSTFFESHRTMQRHECKGTGSGNMLTVNIAQGEADRTAIGHFKPYQTHLLELLPNGSEKKFELERAYADWSASDPTQPSIYSSVNLISKQRTTPLNPYMNIKVSEDLMDGHNDIWGEQVIDFMRELIAVSTTPLPDYKMLSGQ
ncbi:lipase [Paraglaciecola hydrolytica]|uniref:Lipase n=1 Tax=Paraglaciecola hydrolytica TaxID=1799789 RepID=A0A136A0E8_9ALTE|nr:lipase [Paraglaciecola hydrolytica]